MSSIYFQSETDVKHSFPTFASPSLRTVALRFQLDESLGSLDRKMPDGRYGTIGIEVPVRGLAAQVYGKGTEEEPYMVDIRPGGRMKLIACAAMPG